MSSLKIPVLFVGALGTYKSFTAPLPPPQASERPKDVGIFERILAPIPRIWTGIYKVLIDCMSLVEIAVIVASRHADDPLAQKILKTFVMGPVALTSRISFSPTFLVGSALAIAGATFRYQCYRTLGQLHTYEIAIRGNHTLVTSGPYAYVRHPSYTSAFACMVGMGIACFGQGSWARECGVLDTVWGRAAAGMYVAWLVSGSAIAVNRALLEDDLMKKQFGNEWNEWAQRVPYRLIPYVW